MLILWSALCFAAGVVVRWAYAAHKLDSVEAKLRDAEAKAKAAVGAKAKEVQAKL